jgi:hypothetical protein
MQSGNVDDFIEHQAAYTIGQALGQMQAAQRPHERGVRQLTPQQALDRAHKLVGRAFQLYLRGGLTKEQAAQRIVELTQLFSSLE